MSDRAPHLSLAYEGIYDQLLAEIAAREDMPDKVCAHWPMREPTYGGRLLVVGQALNAWMVDAPTASLGDPAERERLLARTRAQSEGPQAWDWMWPAPWGRPFWRLARRAMEHLGIELREIAWSNLAKVAPASGGNPWGPLLGAQHRLGGQLLRQEVDELDPELVLVLSGRGYLEPFLTGADLLPAWERVGARQFDGMLDGRRWLVLNHPGTFAHRFNASREALDGAIGGGLG